MVREAYKEVGVGVLRSLLDNYLWLLTRTNPMSSARSGSQVDPRRMHLYAQESPWMLAFRFNEIQ